MTKKIAVYGSYEAKIPVKQHYWHKRKDGVRQRYWHKPKGRFKKTTMKGRYEFSGKGKDLYKAVVKAQQVMPKGFIDVSAEEFLENPLEYGFEGGWIESEVESQ